ncbi:hypothetical protein ACIBCT_21395 [Streptosporangium sp. NPDC050855]|uniref:hypothetical protein n=1 Tax=Streptosporangium sp. NPDC050855 TaxID=3366194 RepID=UPI0037A58A06
MLRDHLARWWDWRPTWKTTLLLTAATLVITAVSGRPAWLVSLAVVVTAAAVSAAFAYLELHNSRTAPEGDDSEEPQDAPAGGAFAVDAAPDPARHVNLRGEQS